MAVLDYKTLKANIISAGGLGNEYSSSDNDGAGDKFNISGTFIYMAFAENPLVRTIIHQKREEVYFLTSIE